MIIVKAAIMFMNGETVEGYSYSNIISLANRLGISGNHFNGFLTSSEEFVWPSEAADIAFSAKQIPNRLEELSPEDIWPEYVGE